MTRVAIGLPSRGEMVTDTALCLAGLTGYEMLRGGSQLSFVSPRGSLLCILRDAIVQSAMAQDATHILWIDSDMTFPRDGLERLLAHGKPIVGCNYPQRSIPALPTAMRAEGDHIFEVGQSGLEQVEALGFGFCLTEVLIFRAMPRPWFSVQWDEEGERYFGEDYGFCLNAPCPVLLDHDLSREIGHVGAHEFTHADTEVLRDG